MRRSRSQMVRQARETPKPRVTASAPRSMSLRSRFHRTGQRLTGGWRAKARGDGKEQSTGAANVPGVLRVTIQFSAQRVTRTIPPSYLGSEMERWGAIEAGQMPEDEDGAPKVPTDAEMEQAEADAIEEIQDWGRQREAQIRAEAEAEAEAISEEADSLGPRASASRSRAQRDIERVWRKAEQDIEEVGDSVREERDKARRDILKDAEAKQEEYDAHIQALKQGLTKEVETFVLTKYLNNADAEVEDYELD